MSCNLHGQRVLRWLSVRDIASRKCRSQPMSAYVSIHQDTWSAKIKNTCAWLMLHFFCSRLTFLRIFLFVNSTCCISLLCGLSENVRITNDAWRAAHDYMLLYASASYFEAHDYMLLYASYSRVPRMRRQK